MLEPTNVDHTHVDVRGVWMSCIGAVKFGMGGRRIAASFAPCSDAAFGALLCQVRACDFKSEGSYLGALKPMHNFP